MNEKTTLSLPAKLCAIMGEIGAVEKSGRNTAQNYSYVKEADVSESVRKLLSKHGVFCLPSVEEVQEHEIESRSGSKGVFVRVRVKYTFINSENPEDKLECQHFGDGSDYGDKGLYKALTGCHKYMMLRTFCLGSEEDPEKEGKSDEGYRAKSAPVASSGGANPPPVMGDVIGFGKHKGTRWDAVNTNYLEWLCQQKESPIKTKALMELHRRKENQPTPQTLLEDDIPWDHTEQNN